MVKIIITVEGGVIQNYFSNTDNVQIILIDYDDLGDENPLLRINQPDLIFKDGEAHKTIEPRGLYPLSKEEIEAKKFLIENNI